MKLKHYKKDGYNCYMDEKLRYHGQWSWVNENDIIDPNLGTFAFYKNNLIDGEYIEIDRYEYTK